jgi:uncharacterized protein GlcG (DUF336 family)
LLAENAAMNRYLLTAATLASLLCRLSADSLTDPARLEKDDVEKIVAQAASRAEELGQHSIISVVDREGYVLALWSVDSSMAHRPDLQAGAISRAGTAAFLSSNQNAFTSRSAGYIIQQHFPPMVRNTPPGPLVGVGFSSIGGYSDVNFIKKTPMVGPGGVPLAPDIFDPNIFTARFTNPAAPKSPGTFGTAVFGSSLNDSPGGVPLYKEGELVGGIGVTGDHDPIDISTGFAILEGKTRRNSTPGYKDGPDTDEDVALAGQEGFEPPDEILATNVLINGIQVPYVETDTDLGDVKPLGEIGHPVSGFPIQGSPKRFDYPVVERGGVEGEIRFPFRDDPFIAEGRPKIGKAKRLSSQEVENMISLAAERASNTRAGIRLPLGTSAKVFIVIVANPDQDDVPPPILGVFRAGEATIFSWDVAVQKARTALFFSNNKFAQSSRTVGFLAQRYYPPGLDGHPPGPYFGLQEALFFAAVRGKANKNLPDEITIFPGGFPLYREGKLIGAIGVSGDGDDQDDLISASGSVPFEAPEGIRADQYTYRGARLPFAKFPRDPAQ